MLTSTRGAELSAEIIPIEPDAGNADAGNLIKHSQEPLFYAAQRHRLGALDISHIPLS